jgi:putative heme-binding domain-containing protein
MPRTLAALAGILSLCLAYLAPAQKAPVPHGQDSPPGPALTPAEAVKKMKVPEGFTVEVVAAEPDIVNPVSMTFDEKGRVWITESVEYPRRSPGVGKDRVKVIDIGPDGKASKVTVFADGLNIPSGIAVGHGGVWVANSPDILFYKVGPDGKAAGKPEVVVTGFGRDDTHELPNSLTWGPDGWLYGWNGVFNQSHVKQNGKEWKFTCAVFRIHPKTREFQLFCEGTSNPWGLAIDPEGSLFASACVIDHLWHLTETGYYLRQGGPYPPFTWPMRSIVKHRHQKAAYCGIHYFDSDAYPKEYRDRLYMGNIHGGCINMDTIKRDGSTYVGTSAPDFLTANDQWFMPVAQKTGPDGCLYILDWYDRYHCYQDANRDPKGIDRLNGRLYRVRYKETPRAEKFDLAGESDEKLVERLASGNVYYRDIAQRILTERLLTPKAGSGLPVLLEKVIFDDKSAKKTRMHALWALVGGNGVDDAVNTKLLAHKDASLRAWGVRAAGNRGKVDAKVRDKIGALAKHDPSPDVRLQVAIAVRKIKPQNDDLAVVLLLTVLKFSSDDTLIPHIVWQNLHPLLEEHAELFIAMIALGSETRPFAAILPRAAERILASGKPKAKVLSELYDLVSSAKPGDAALERQVVASLTARVLSGELSTALTAELESSLGPRLAEKMAKGANFDAAALLAALNNKSGLAEMRRVATDEKQSEALRIRAVEVLAARRDAETLPIAAKMLVAKTSSPTMKAAALSALSRLEDDKVAAIVLDAYDGLPADIKPRAIDILTQRDAWGKALLGVIAAKKLPPGVLNVNQARRLLASKDKELVALVTKHWGTLRTDRSPEREKVVGEMRAMLSRTKGDPKKGITVYKNLCGQCHKIHGEGVEVGPDITSNGRASFDQLLSNVFDPSLVIGPGYHAVGIETTRGRVLTGLLAEDGPARVVLKVQGGKQEIVARKDIEKMEVSKLSLMPEGIEKQLKPQEIADLMAFLCLDKHPDDKNARRIPGTPKGLFGQR